MCPGNLEPLSFTPFDVSVCSLGLKLTAASITYDLLEITLNIQQKVSAKFLTRSVVDIMYSCTQNPWLGVDGPLPR